jgi:Cd2+/Zn2+-exporting ATPase
MAQDHATHVHNEDMSCCSHHEVSIERWIIFTLIGGILVLASTVAGIFGLGSAEVSKLPAMLGAVLLAIPLFIAAWNELRTLRISSSALAALAIIAAIAIGEYTAAGWLAFILVVFGQLVRRSASGAQRAIEQLVRLTPDIARVVRDGIEYENIPLSQVKVGDVVRVRSGENLPVDGRVIAGRSTLNQASLTGESAPVEVTIGDNVYAGTSNLTGNLDIQVTQVGADTTIGRVTQLIREAEQSRTPRQLLIEQVASFFVPVVLSVAAIAWFIMSQSDDVETKRNAMRTAVTVLVVACPSALLLASPSAMLAAIGEQHSNHPLAQSILTTARAARVRIEETTNTEEVHGRGVRARTSKGEICVGRASWLRELNPAIAADIEAVEAKIEGMTGVHVMRDGRYLGAVGLEDTIRSNTKSVVQRLRDLGIRYIAIFTGDRLSVAKRVGAAVGVDAIEAECLPEEKHQLVRDMVKSGFRTLMVGDGINDGPSLAEADVGVAMGLEGSDIAANSAGVALMNDDLSRIPFLIELSRRTRAITTQNIVMSVIIAIVGLVLAATGTITSIGALALPVAAFYHFAGDIFVIGNSFRLFRFGEDYAEAEKPAEQTVLGRRAASVRGLATQSV